MSGKKKLSFSRIQKSSDYQAENAEGSLVGTAAAHAPQAHISSLCNAPKHLNQTQPRGLQGRDSRFIGILNSVWQKVRLSRSEDLSDENPGLESEEPDSQLNNITYA